MKNQLELLLKNSIEKIKEKQYEIFNKNTFNKIQSSIIDNLNNYLNSNGYEGINLKLFKDPYNNKNLVFLFYYKDQLLNYLNIDNLNKFVPILFELYNRNEKDYLKSQLINKIIHQFMKQNVKFEIFSKENNKKINDFINENEILRADIKIINNKENVHADLELKLKNYTILFNNIVNYDIAEEIRLDRIGKEVRLSGLYHESLSNGPGMRRVFFAQGCKHKCEKCFNPETHNFNGGQLKDIYDLVEDTLDNEIIKGVTFSGGDPWEQAEKFAYMAEKFQENNLNVWCYTGYTFEYILENKFNHLGWNELLNNIDVLVDGRFVYQLKSDNLKFKGSSNQRIIDVKESLKQNKVIELTFD